MHVIFVHSHFPAQFGHIAAWLARERGDRCTFVSETPAGDTAGIRHIRFARRGGATEHTHYCSRTVENTVWQAAAIYETLKPLRRTLEPDLIVGHPGYGPTAFLPELFPSTPIVSYSEFYYHAHGSDLDFRPDVPVPEYAALRASIRNAMLLLDLDQCTAAYTPTHFQHGLLPDTYRHKVDVIHDGIPTDFWRQQPVERTLGTLRFEPGTRIVTYVSRGLEATRGFDIFMKAAKKIYTADPRVVFLVVGSDRVWYGGDLTHIQELTFKSHVLGQDDYDLSRIRFLGTVDPATLVHILNLSDLHIYLTVPFVLSWSMLNAMSCGCVVLASDTAPVTEIVADGVNGLLVDFFDVDRLASRALDVLENPAAHRDLGIAAAATVRDRYCTNVTLPRLAGFFDRVATGHTSAKTA